MKKVKVEDAVGMILCHDITKIVPEKFKGTAFKKGHIIQKEDIPELLKIGKEHLYVWEQKPGKLHENAAAKRIAKIASGENLKILPPAEGKCTFVSEKKGLFEVKSDILLKINSVPMISVATLPKNFKVEKGMKVAGSRVIPLVIDENYVIQVENICKEMGPAFKVTPYKKLKAGIVVTGSEVYKGRIKDKFGPVMEKKLSYFGADILGKTYCPDNIKDIKNSIISLKEKGANIIIVTGGMSVDPDDLTPGAIRQTGAKVITYGVPVQPGNMFMLSYLEGSAILGVPGCAMFMKTTVLDAVLPRIFAGHILEKGDFISMGEGGFCFGCKPCKYPVCYFCRN